MNISTAPLVGGVGDDVVDSDTAPPLVAHDATRTVRTTPVWGSGWTWFAAVVVTVGRWLEAADRRVFHVAPDEPGQLAMARWLAGETRWNMFDHLTWRPGYAVTLAPLARVFDGGEALVRAALTLNAVFAGLSCVCLTFLVRRWTDLGPRAAAGVSAVVALAPAAIASSAYTWAESLVTLMFLVTLVALQLTVDRRSTWAVVLAIVAAAFAMTVHGRSLPMLPVAACIVAIVLLADGRWKAATATTGLAALLGLASLRFTDWVLSSVWDDPSDANTADEIVSRLDAPAALFDSFAGQAWYQLVASAGMVGLGAGLVLAALVRPTPQLGRIDALLIVAMTTPLVATSVTFMAGRERPDQLVYGRYVDAVVWPLAALGLAWTLRRLRPVTPTSRAPLPMVVAVITVAVGVIVAFRHGDLRAGDVGLRMMVPGLLPYIGNGDGVPVLTITAVTTMVLGALALASAIPHRRRVPRTVLIAAAVVVVGWGGLRVHDAQTNRLNTWAIGSDVAEVAQIVPDGERIGVVMQRDATIPTYVEQRQRFQVYQLFLPDHEFVWERRPNRVASRFVFAPHRVRELSDAGYVVRWYDPRKPMALWERSDDVDGPSLSERN